MGQSDARSIEQFRGRLGLVYLTKYTLTALAAWAFLYGTAVLALRGGLGLSRADVLWGLLSLPAAVVPAALLARRRLPSAAAVRAVLDRHGRCGGLLMAGEEQPLGAWADELPAIRMPEVRWRSAPSWALLAGGLAFVALAFLVPQGFADLGPGRLDVERETDKLARQLEVLEKEKVLEPKRAEELKEQLERVRKEAKGGDPGKTLESLDHLQELVTKAAQEASESAARKNEKLGQAEAMSEAVERLARKRNKLDAGGLTEAMQQLARLTRKAADEKELLDSGLDPETLDALKDAASLSPEQLKKLAEALRECKGTTGKKVGKLVKARLVDASELEKCDKAGKCDCEGLAALLKEGGCKSGLCDAIATCQMPGRGGISRGPGPAKLTFGDETSEAGARFKELELPPAALQSLKDSQLAGISTGDPTQKAAKGGPAGSGALDTATAGGGSANTQPVLPRHRRAVERYFDRATNK
ncbi:MAG: hypothetical protein U0736_14720 [Gemmataceae bacterium]